MKNLITIKNLNKKFKEGFKNTRIIFENLNLDILENEQLAIIGKNGVGKTILFETILGLRNLSKGKIQFHYEYNKTPYEKISFLFQKDDLIDIFNVSDYIKLLKKDKLVDKIFLEKLLNKFEIVNIAKSKIKNLSGGEKQRLKLLICFAHKPKIFFLDEFNNNLDILIKEETIQFIKEYVYEQKASLVIISHEPEDIKKIANKITFFQDGKLSPKINIANLETSKVKELILKNLT